jgi:hypothetical protein
LQTFEDEAIFVTPLEASELRVLFKEPSGEDFKFTLDVIGCYDRVLIDLGNFVLFI